MSQRFPYRKLPGVRRGFFRSASVWLGTDYLLLVRSLRFREEYKRYQFRDIQAIVLAKAPRFHISTRAFWIGVLWVAMYLAARIATARNLFSNRVSEQFSIPIAARPVVPDWPTVLWMVAALLVAAWLIVSSSLCSCRCRIYTAVSRDELPSLYRIWTARKFLRQVEPLIEQAQGPIQGEWVKEVENRYIGPAEAVDSEAMAARDAVRKRTRSLASDVLIASLFADALLNALNMHSTASWVGVANAAVTLVELAAAIAVMVGHHRGALRAGMQRLAIATVAAMGIFFYARPIVVGFMASARAAAAKQPVAAALPVDPQMRAVDALITAFLGLAGLVIMLLGRDDADPTQVITPSS
jgi:hypothetical protein